MRYTEAYIEETHPDLIAIQKETTEGTVVVAIERSVLDDILRVVPWSPDRALKELAARAVKRLPCPNGPDEERVITRYNLAVIWP